MLNWQGEHYNLSQKNLLKFVVLYIKGQLLTVALCHWSVLMSEPYLQEW
jgi:hypothetical protein